MVNTPVSSATRTPDEITIVAMRRCLRDRIGRSMAVMLCVEARQKQERARSSEIEKSREPGARGMSLRLPKAIHMFGLSPETVSKARTVDRVSSDAAACEVQVVACRQMPHPDTAIIRSSRHRTDGLLTPRIAYVLFGDMPVTSCIA